MSGAMEFTAKELRPASMVRRGRRAQGLEAVRRTSRALARRTRGGTPSHGRPAETATRAGRRLWAAVLAVVVFACGTPSATDSPGDATAGPGARTVASDVVRVLGSWEESELETMRSVVAPFEAQTGHQVEFITTRDLKAELEARIAAGYPPDIAGLPGPGFMIELARARQLVDLGTVIDLGSYKRQTAPAFVHLGTVDGRLVGVFLKGTVKGLLWYNPDVFRAGPLDTWARLQHAAMTSVEDVRPWCIGLASGASSGWPGTDWIEDFLLRQSGPQAYDEWIAGRLAWTSPEVRWAFQSFGTVIGDQDVAGGIAGALETHFSRAGDGLFTDPPECLFVHQGTFMSTFLDDAVASSGGRYELMPFPDIDPRFRGALIGAGDLIALLRDTPGSRALLAYLLGEQAQSILVGAGGALSGNVLLQDYPDPRLEQQAQLLAQARIFRFDASDAMPDEMSRAFWQAALDFAADQSRLEEILSRLEAVRASAYRPD
jgi:alpha-glucoside transport system substrate-binding protein